jgi:hypothetical protein
MNKKNKTLVAIFCYNVEKNIIAVIKKITKYNLNQNCNILLIDDCSKDKTLFLLKRNKIINSKIISNKINQGFGKNYKLAINFAVKNHYQKIIFLHGDDQYPSNKVDIIRKKLDYFSLCYGSRRRNIKSMLVNMPLPRFVANVILTYIINIFLRNNATEYFSGFRGINVNFLKKINYKKLSDSWIIEQQVHFEFIKKKFKISEIPINTIYEKNQKSMIPPFSYVLDVIRNMINYSLFK